MGRDERTAVGSGDATTTLLREMGVEVVASTDDPTSSLEYHERAVDEVSGVDVVPTWRADRALTVDCAAFGDFVADLEDATGIETDGFAGSRGAVGESRLLRETGCRASDVSVRQPVSRPVDESRARAVYERALAGGSVTDRDIEDFQAFLLEYVGELNAEKGWVTQLHIGPVRNYRSTLYERIGPAAGGDVSTGEVELTDSLGYLLNRLDGETEVILYALDPTHYPTMATMARVFPNVSIGPAWWFNDSPFGMERQLEYAGTVELLYEHAGMVSDSRKLLSYGSRFEMFRRSLANVVGRQVERGQMPMDVAHDVVSHLAYDRPKELYGF